MNFTFRPDNTIFRLDIYTDDNNVSDQIFATTPEKAEAFKELLLTDPGLQGISRIEIVLFPVDDKSMDDFYTSLTGAEEFTR